MTASPWPFSSRFDAADALPASRPGGLPLVLGPDQWRGNWPPMLHSANEPNRSIEGTTGRVARTQRGRSLPSRQRQDTVLFLSYREGQKPRFQGVGPLRYAPWSIPPNDPRRTGLWRAAIAGLTLDEGSTGSTGYSLWPKWRGVSIGA